MTTTQPDPARPVDAPMAAGDAAEYVTSIRDVLVELEAKVWTGGSSSADTDHAARRIAALPRPGQNKPTDADKNRRVARARETVAYIRKSMIPVGKTVRSATTLAAAPADMTAIECGLDALASRLAEAEAALAQERGRVERLRTALRKADEDLLSRVVSNEINRNEGKLPSREWVQARRGVIESNHYANDGLEFGDLDPEPTP